MATDGAALLRLCSAYLRMPTRYDASDPASFVWVPPLTSSEQAAFADLEVMATFGVELTLAEWQSIKADAAALKAYNGVATPTLAQTAAAVKAINRVLATIVRS